MKQFLAQAKLLGTLTVKDKSSLFWAFLYPILLVTMMMLAFRGIGTGMEPVKAAVETGHPYVEILRSLDQLDLSVLEGPEAGQALRAKAVDGVFLKEGSLLVRGEGLNATILQEIGNEIKRQEAAARLGRFPDPGGTHVTLANQESGLLQSILCATVGMFSLYSFFAGLGMIERVQANLSPLAARLAISPLSKLSYLTAGTLVNTILAFLESTLLLIYLKYAWSVNLLTDLPRTLLLLFLAGLFGLCLGLFAASSNKLPSMGKTVVGIAVLLLLGAFGGMMGNDLRLFLDRQAPWLNRYNPVSLISRLLYRLNALGSTREYLTGVLLLLAASILLFSLAFALVRKASYRSL